MLLADSFSIDQLTSRTSSARFAHAEGHRAADRHRHGDREVFPGMVGVFAEFETNLRQERQLEGNSQGEGCRRL
jgi:hypothetical protein